MDSDGKIFLSTQSGLFNWNGGEGGIRTLGPPKGSPDFESGPFGHSGTSPFCKHTDIITQLKLLGDRQSLACEYQMIEIGGSILHHAWQSIQTNHSLIV